MSEAAPPPLCGDDGAGCVEPARGVWREIQAAADAFYDRSEACTFTTLVAYEWSGAPGTANLHRNFIFRGDVVLDAGGTPRNTNTPLGIGPAYD